MDSSDKSFKNKTEFKLHVVRIDNIMIETGKKERAFWRRDIV